MSDSYNPVDCVACQAPPSMEFSRQEYWSGLPFPSTGDFPDLGIVPGSPALQADFLFVCFLGFFFFFFAGRCFLLTEQWGKLNENYSVYKIEGRWEREAENNGKESKLRYLLYFKERGWEDSIREGNGYPFQYSCLENLMDRGDWWATVHEVTELDTT